MKEVKIDMNKKYKSMPIKWGAITPDNILSFIEKEYDAGNKEKVMKLAKMMNDKCISLSRENKVLKNKAGQQDTLRRTNERSN